MRKLVQAESGITTSRKSSDKIQDIKLQSLQVGDLSSEACETKVALRIEIKIHYLTEIGVYSF